MSSFAFGVAPIYEISITDSPGFVKSDDSKSIEWSTTAHANGEPGEWEFGRGAEPRWTRRKTTEQVDYVDVKVFDWLHAKNLLPSPSTSETGDQTPDEATASKDNANRSYPALIRPLTISRDHTSASDFCRDQLLALVKAEEQWNLATSIHSVCLQ
jgi:hypothetical protein